MTQTQRRLAALSAAVMLFWPAGAALAQLAPDDAPAAQTAPTAPTQPTTVEVPARNDDGAGVTRQDGGLVLNFENASIDVILDELSRAAGYIVVKEVQPEGRVSLVSRQPIAPDEAVTLLNTVLHNAGYSAIQQGRILKIVSSDTAKRLSIPVHSGNDPDAIAPTDELITQVIPLRHANAQELRQDLQPLLNPDADFTANASSNVLVITDTSANIRRIVQIISALDTSMAESVDVRVFQLQYANATNAAELINNVFGDLQIGRPGGNGGDDDDDGPGGGWRRFQRAMEQQNQGGQGAQINAAADERTNSVVVTGPGETLAVVAEVINQLDENPVADETVFVYRLRNAQAINIEAVVNNLFGNPTSGTVGTNNTQTNRLDRANSRTNSGRTIGGGGGTFGGGGGGRFGGNGGTGGFGQNNNNNNRFAQQQQNTPWGGGGRGGFFGNRFSQDAAQTAADLAGQVTIIADPDTNSLLVRTSPSNYERVRQVLDELDRPVAQVLIKVLIAEVTHDTTTDFGTEFSILNIRASGLGQEVGTNFNIPTGAVSGTGLVVQVLEQDFTAAIRILEQNGKLDVLSRPYILASDNQLASITVGQEVPFVTNSRITDDGQTINTIEYGDVGILLDVVPHINPDGLVILDVAPEISTLTGTTVPISELVSAPVIAKRSAESRVGVRNGQTIVIGGLMEDRKTETINKVPLLGDIPLVGALFRRAQTTKAKTELLIFLTPHVASDPDQLEAMGQQEQEGTHLVPGAVEPGLFDEHMDGLQRGRTALEGEVPVPATRPDIMIPPPAPIAPPQE